MKVDVKHIAELSRLALTEEEKKKFEPQMKTILESASILQEVDTSNVAPMKTRIVFEELREDVSKKGLSQEEVVKNAPHSEDGFVKVYGDVFGEEGES